MYHCLLESSDAEIGASLRALLSSAERGAPALFFCRMGKDRTGLVAALVLSICGADERAILDDYVLSDDPSAEEIALGGLEKSRDLQGLETRLFARAPREAMEGALRVVVDPAHGLPAWLDGIDRAAAGWRDSQRLLEREGRVQVELPPPPRQIVWDEVWSWLEPRRAGVGAGVPDGG